MSLRVQSYYFFSEQRMNFLYFYTLKMEFVHHKVVLHY